MRPTSGVWLGLDGAPGFCALKGPARPMAGLTWGWKSSGDGRRYFSFRTPTGSGTFRFSTLLDSNTEGYVPRGAAPPGSCLRPIGHEAGDLTTAARRPQPPHAQVSADGCADVSDPATLLPTWPGWLPAEPSLCPPPCSPSPQPSSKVPESPQGSPNHLGYGRRAHVPAGIWSPMGTSLCQLACQLWEGLPLSGSLGHSEACSTEGLPPHPASLPSRPLAWGTLPGWAGERE